MRLTTLRLRLARWLLRGTPWTVYRQRKARTRKVAAAR
jgi:hypothetical protein